MLYNIALGLNDQPSINSTVMLVLNTVCYLTLCPMMPQFIINVRELYYSDARGRWQGSDSGFKALPQFNYGENAVRMTEIAFVNVASRRGSIMEGAASKPEVIRLEALGDSPHRV